MASLRDIAESLGVSIALVSKVLNNKMGTTGVRPELKDAILQRADKLGYRRNDSALALLTGRHHMIGCYVHRLGAAGSGIIENLLTGISEEARRREQKLFLGLFEQTADFMDLSRLAHKGMMDGLIVGGVSHPDLRATLLEIRRKGLPVVTIQEEPLDKLLPNVGMDQEKVGRIATEHLIKQGCRRIGHISTVPTRCKGYRAALKKAGLPFTSSRVFETSRNYEFGHDQGERAALQFLEQGIELDGLFAQSDEEAMGFVRIMQQHGLKIPGDIKVIGVDNAPYCEFGPVRLSSVDQRFNDHGREAVNLLLALLDKKPAAHVWLEPKLVARESTART